MKKTIMLSFLVLVVACMNQKKSGVAYDESNKRYTTYCASCHGEKVNEFRNIKWKYGTSKNELIKSITDGYPDFGMPSFKTGLSKKQIEKLAELMLAALNDDKHYTTVATNNKYQYDSLTITLDTIASGFDKPWGFAQLPNGEYLITAIDGSLYKIINKVNIRIDNVPTVVNEGQGGLLDIALHPNYTENGWIYMSYSKPHPTDAELATTAIVRGKIVDNKLINIEELFVAKPYATTRHHYGSRITFDNDNNFYFSVGDRGKHFEYPQQLDNDNGKIHKLKDDGTIPADNPFVNDKKANASIYSYGHRNPQGLYYNKLTNQLWEHEHGPKGGDEINIIKKGVNYGWPVISYGINYDGSILTKERTNNTMEQPQWYWIPSIAPSGMCVVTSNKYKQWKNKLLIGSLKFNYISIVTLNDDVIVKDEKILEGIGRVRDVKMGDDGYIYITKENPNLLLKVMPQ